MLNLFVLNAPIFLLILTGFSIQKLKPDLSSFWQVSDKLVYYLFAPTLLILEISHAKLSAGHLAVPLAVMCSATLLMAIVVLLIKPLLNISNATFSSVFQGSTRFNLYIFLAVTHAYLGAQGLAIAGVLVAYMIILTNAMSVIMLSHYGSLHKKTRLDVVLSTFKNPLIVGSLVGLLLNLLSINITGVFEKYMTYMSHVAMPLSLMSIGAGLVFGFNQSHRLALILMLVLKLCVLPLMALLAFFCINLWIPQTHNVTFAVAVLYCAVPCAGNSYILAKEMGGDYQLMASMITFSTLCSSVSIPVLYTFVT